MNTSKTSSTAKPAGTKAAASKSVSASRSVAYDLLRAVLSKRTPLDEALAAHDGLAKLPERDRGFTRMLVGTTLRRLGQIDKMLGRCMSKPLPRKAESMREVLRMAVAELVFLGVAPHAAVDSAVTLIRSRGYEGITGLANAVLHKIAREGTGWLQSMDARDALPDWLAERWVAAYGAETANAMAEACQLEPTLDLSVKSDPEGWAKKLEAKLLATGTLRRGFDGSIERLAGFADGAWWVQDLAAALPVKLLGDVSGKTVFDLCCAPGGKTAQLVSGGGEVVAVDRLAARLRRTERNLTRLGLAASTVEADVTTWKAPGLADVILLDAPCSSTGTIRRHPDVPWLKATVDIDSLAKLQDRLLDAAAKLLKPGGMMVYCVCSLEPEEGEARAAALLDRHKDLTRKPIMAAEIGGFAELITADGDLRSRPDLLASIGGLDGFFATRVVKAG